MSEVDRCDLNRWWFVDHSK